jgi:deoxyadenosine/deoxycytidine kinase
VQPFIVVAGNIGVGKAGFVKALAEQLNVPAYHGTYARNPYLQRYYLDREQWAFHSQLFFLVEALSEHRAIQSSDHGAVQHRSIYEHFEIFARDLAARDLIRQEDFDLLANLMRNMMAVLRPPDLVVVLDAPVDWLLERIRQRGRQMEQRVDEQHLRNLATRYDQFVNNWELSPLLRIDASRRSLNDTEVLDGIFAEIQNYSL